MNNPKRKRHTSSICSSNNTIRNGNPLWTQQQFFLQSLSNTERESFFDSSIISTERRAQIWDEQATLGEQLVNAYAWATPDPGAMCILKHFAPIVEIGCGSNAYWCKQLRAMDVDVVGYDTAPHTGGTILMNAQCNANAVVRVETSPQQQKDDFKVQLGGPEVLSQHSDRTLFLCYPDESTSIDPDTNESFSMASECLRYYQGEYVIHVGELLVTGCLSLDEYQAPWGRSSSTDFQERLATEFHCVLVLELSNWLHTTDRLTVWKRSHTTTIVFEVESDDEDDEEEEVQYRHIPVEERLPVNVAAPCLQKLINAAIDANVKMTNDVKLKIKMPSVIPKSDAHNKTDAHIKTVAKEKKARKRGKKRHSNPENPVKEETREYISPW